MKNVRKFKLFEFERKRKILFHLSHLSFRINSLQHREIAIQNYWELELNGIASQRNEGRIFSRKRVIDPPYFLFEQVSHGVRLKQEAGRRPGLLLFSYYALSSVQLCRVKTRLAFVELAVTLRLFNQRPAEVAETSRMEQPGLRLRFFSRFSRNNYCSSWR